MTPNRPYLIRALNDWILDNSMTPHLLVDAKAENVQVPPGFVDDGKIVLNISTSAVKGLEIGDDSINFNARFNGTLAAIHVPVVSVLAIYARENGLGMIFPEEKLGEKSSEDPVTSNKGPHLRVVK